MENPNARFWKNCGLEYAANRLMAFCKRGFKFRLSMYMPSACIILTAPVASSVLKYRVEGLGLIPKRNRFSSSCSSTLSLWNIGIVLSSGHQDLIYASTSASDNFRVCNNLLHWSLYGRQYSFTNALLPLQSARPCRGRAIRFPSFPSGRLSCIGIIRS